MPKNIPTPSKKSCLKAIRCHVLEIKEAERFFAREKQKEVQTHLAAIENYKKILHENYNYTGEGQW